MAIFTIDNEKSETCQNLSHKISHKRLLQFFSCLSFSKKKTDKLPDNIDTEEIRYGGDQNIMYTHPWPPSCYQLKIIFVLISLRLSRINFPTLHTHSTSEAQHLKREGQTHSHFKMLTQGSPEYQGSISYMYIKFPKNINQHTFQFAAHIFIIVTNPDIIYWHIHFSSKCTHDSLSL